MASQNRRKINEGWDDPPPIARPTMARKIAGSLMRIGFHIVAMGVLAALGAGATTFYVVGGLVAILLYSGDHFAFGGWPSR